MLRALFPILLLGLATPTMAQDNADWLFGGDAYMAGRTVTVSGETVDDLFAAGDKVTVQADVDGTAHVAGRYLTIDNRIGENLYGAGMQIDVNAPVAGNATLMGDSLSITEPVSGNLRATGSRIDLSAPVAGNAILAGETVTIDATIVGDLALAAANVSWGDDAKVQGDVHIYSDNPEAVDVPERVASSSNVIFHETHGPAGMGDMSGGESPSFLQKLRGWLGGVLFIGVLGTIFAAIAPNYLAGLRERALERPVKSGVAGFVGLSALIGSIVLLGMTGIGILLIPVSLVVAVLLGVLGYVVGAYALGVWATGMAGRGVPNTLGERAIAAFAGAVVVALIALIPWLGWLAVMAIFLVGAGALVRRILRHDDDADVLA